MASEPLEWCILITVVGVDKQALLTWWEQLVCTDHTVQSDKEYLKTILEFEGVVRFVAHHTNSTNV